MPERVLKNWPLKLLSLVIAFAIWVSITGEARIPKDFDLPLDIQLQEGRMLARPVPTAVKVRLQGPARVIRKLDPLKLSVQLDMRSTPPGERDMQFIERHLLNKPDDVDVVFFQPDRVSLVVDQRLRRQLQVVPDLVGEVPAGYHIYKTLVRPETVFVEGPLSEVSKLRQLRTDPIPLGNRTATFSKEVGAIPDRTQVRVVDPGPLDVRVVIDDSPVERTFDKIPVMVNGDEADDAAVEPGTVRVVLTGPPSLLDRLPPSQIRGIADTSELQPGQRAGRVPVQAVLTNLLSDQQWRVGVKSVSPKEVSIRLPERRAD